jgi:F-type H+-transporting ATPase subunit delta
MSKHTTITSTAATAYARSLIELAGDQNQAQEIGDELVGIQEAIDATPGFDHLLVNPAVGEGGRVPILARAFEGKVHPLMWNFLRLLNAKNRLGLLRQIGEVYADLLDEKFGKVEVDVTVAHRLDDQELEQVRVAVGEALKRDAVVHQYVDESIIGGLVIRVQDKLIDTSVRAQLAAMKQKMLAARPRATTTA